MRSPSHCSGAPAQLHQWAMKWLLQAELLQARRPRRRCTPSTVWHIILRAAVQLISISAACLDRGGPCGQAIFNALRAGLPQTFPALERRLHTALTQPLRRRSYRRRAWRIAIDWHLIPYYGQPHRQPNELYRGKPRQGTKQFHAYATACIVMQGHRYTVALTWVRRREATVAVLQRLLQQIRCLGLKIKVVLLDRAFFTIEVINYLKGERLPFLMPVLFRGRRPKKRAPATGLRRLARFGAGHYTYTLQNRHRQATLTIVVAYQSSRKDGRRRHRKLLFGAWRVGGTPREIRNLYRTRFGIETSYRQLRQARAVTCTREPRLRLVLVAVALLLRNLWVWVRVERGDPRPGSRGKTRGDPLRFKQLLRWIAQEIDLVSNNESTTCGTNST